MLKKPGIVIGTFNPGDFEKPYLNEATMDNYYVLIGMILFVLIGVHSGWSITKNIDHFNENKGDYDTRSFYLRIIITEVALILVGVIAFIMLFIKALDVL